jgi:hypothetical protein
VLKQRHERLLLTDNALRMLLSKISSPVLGFY